MFLGNKFSIIFVLCLLVIFETVLGGIKSKKQKEIFFFQKKGRQIELYMKEENNLAKKNFVAGEK